MLSSKDQRLVQRLLQKDENALREFYVAYKDSLLQYLQRSLSNEDAEEVLQDAFMNTIDALRNFRGQSSLKTFLYSIAKRKAVDKLRKKSIKRVLFSYFPEKIVDSLATVFMKDTLDQKHLEKKIERIFQDLPNDYSLVIRLKYKEGYKISEIAKRFNLSPKAAESLLFRARKAFITTYDTYERQGLFSIKETFR
jgi:RNA polymerase sigma-70 factor (ECF subfamily)